MIKRATKYFSYLFGSILIILLILLFCIQTNWFKNLVKEQIETVVSRQMNARVKCGGLDGNFYNNLSVSQVKFLEKEDSLEIAVFENLHIRYNLLKLLKKKIQIDSLVLTKPEVELIHKQDSSWNITHLFPDSKGNGNVKESNFPFVINADHVFVRDMRISVQSKIALMPDTIDQLNIETSFYYDSTQIKVHLKEFELKTSNPDISIISLSTRFQKHKSVMELDSLRLKTKQSFISLSGEYNGVGNNNVSLLTNPLSSDELSIFVPSIRLMHSPNIESIIKSSNDTVSFDVRLSVASEEIHLKAQLFNLEKLVNKEKVKVPYSANISFYDVHFENWWDTSGINGVINGAVSVAGNDLLNYRDGAQLNADINNASLQDYRFNQLLVNAKQNGSTITSQINLQSRLGSADGEVVLNDLFSKPTYNALLNLDSIAISDFFKEMKPSLLNGSIEVQGTGFKMEEINIDGLLGISSSSVYGVPIDSARVLFKLSNNDFAINEGQFFIPETEIRAKGKYNISMRSINMETRIESNSIAFIDSIYLPEFEYKYLDGSALITGAVDSLLIDGTLSVQQFEGFSFTSDHVYGSYGVDLINGNFSSRAKIDVEDFSSGNIWVDTIKAEAVYADSLLRSELTLTTKDSVYVFARSSLQMNNGVSLNIPEMEIIAPSVHYYIADSVNNIHFGNHQIEVDNILIMSEQNDAFLLRANGQISNVEEQNFVLKINNLDLQRFNRFNFIPNPIQGFLSADVELSGAPIAPKMKTDFQMTPGSYGEWQIPALKGSVNLSDQLLSTQIKMPALNDGFEFTYTSPLVFNFDSSGVKFEAPKTFDAHLLIDSIDIAQPLNKEQLEVAAGGSLWADLTVSGDFDSPLFYGGIALKDGMYKDETFGLDFNNANIKLSFDGDVMQIDTFLVKRENGFLSVSGEAVFDSSLITGKIMSSSLHANADKFFLARHKDYEIQIDANTFIESVNKKQEFGGKIKVLRSDFYLPAFITDDDDSNYEDVPLLIQAITDQDSIEGEMPNEVKESKQRSSNFMKSLTGRLNLEIPRNTWLRSEEMKIEIWGDLEVEKSSSYFELFGEVGINRGHYILYGKKLNIQDGKITFQGGETIDPMLDFKASYTYRGADKQKRELELLVSERLSEPKINFNLDGVALPEADAVSILLFGKTMDEMSYAGQNGIVGSMGTNMVAQMVTSQLSKTIGARFQLDMIEVNATENWQSAAFVVGKYITNDLFVIYQRGFGETEGDEITPETVTLEYELNRILFFRLQSGSSKDSGFDVILKFESKKD